MKPVIAITMGDPAGIGPEVILKALSRPAIRRICRPVVIGDRGVLRQTARRLKLSAELFSVSDPEEAVWLRRGASVIDLRNVDRSLRMIGRPDAACGRAAVEAIRAAVRLAMDRRVAAVVTAPIGKEALHAAGCPYPGHTELLADLSGTQEVGMLMVAPPRSKNDPGLRILLATTHVALRDLPRQLTRQRVQGVIRLGHEAAVRYFGFRRPRLAVTGLNPHAGEGGLFGDEERRVIRPAVEAARRKGIPVAGPLPADSLIRQAHEGRYDLVIAMYHDQALIPIKLLAFERAVNMTVGLPFIRTSPDHGTAYDITGKGTADPGSLIEAIRLAVNVSTGKRPYKPSKP